MTIQYRLMAALAAATLLSVPVYAGPGGNGNGNGQGADNGNGGNSADAGSQSQGHGAETSAAATDPGTHGLDKALSVVGTTPASPQASLSIQAAIDALLGRNGENTDSTD